MSALEFQTERLRVVPWGGALADPIERAALVDQLDSLLTEQVLRPLPPSLQRGQGPSGIEDWIAARDAESDVYMIRSRMDDSLLGLLIMVVVEGPTGPLRHIGYLFDHAAWGQGYATEMLKGLVAAAPSKPPLAGGVGTGNPASAHVLRKVGFLRSPQLSSPDTDVFVTP